jgi:transposase
MREIINGIFYVMRAGCPWRLVPSDLPPWGTIYRWFAVWRDDGRFERIADDNDFADDDGGDFGGDVPTTLETSRLRFRAILFPRRTAAFVWHAAQRQPLFCRKYSKYSGP